MKHLKRFNDSVNEEFFGGKSSDILLPRLDDIDAKLAEVRTKVASGISDKDTKKIETIYNYLINDMDLEMLATQSRKAAELTGRRSKETFGEKIKRSIHNF